MRKLTVLLIIAIGMIIIGAIVMSSSENQRIGKGFERTLIIEESGDCCVPITKQSNTTISITEWNNDSVVLKISNESVETKVTLWRRFGNPTIIIFNNSKISLGLMQYAQTTEGRFAKIWLAVTDV